MLVQVCLRTMDITSSKPAWDHHTLSVWHVVEPLDDHARGELHHELFSEVGWVADAFLEERDPDCVLLGQTGADLGDREEPQLVGRG